MRQLLTLAVVGFMALASCAGAADAVSFERVMEVGDLPAGGLALVPVPESLAGDGTLRVRLDGADVLSQEILGAGEVVLRVTPEQVAASRVRALPLEMARVAPSASAAGKHADKVTVETPAFALSFDRARGGALPNRVRWAGSGKSVTLDWKDRVYAVGSDQGLAGTWFLAQDPKARLTDVGKGPLFRQVRTSGGFLTGGRRSAADPQATYEWIFPNDRPEWVYLVMATRQDNPGTWLQHWTGVVHVPYGSFPACVTDAAQLTPKAVPAADAKTPVRWAGRTFAALLDGRDFMAAYSPNTCTYFDPKGKVAYLHSTETVSRQEWPGTPDRRAVFFRWGSSKDPSAALVTPPPMARPSLLRRLDLAAAAERVRPGESVAVARVANLAIAVGVLDGTRAEVKCVKVDGRTVATGPQPLFEVSAEEVATGRRVRLDSTRPWREVAVGADGRSWTFRGPTGHPALAGLSVTVRVAPGADGASAEWQWRGTSGSRDWALAEATVGAISLDGTGAGMRALYPHVMGRVARDPCSASLNYRGAYPAMHCAMQWEAAWDEARGRCFYVGAHDPHTGAKFIGMRGLPDRSALRIELTHRLSWDGANPAAESALPGPVVWKAMPGDWYDAALFYRDWSRAHCRSYPQMGPDGRVSTPKWFKELGFIVRTHGTADTATNDVRTAMDYLGVPVMAQWYRWHQIPFDNDYPHYFPAKPGFEEGLRQIHAWGAKAVPYTNGHIWDMHDRGCEDWKFSREGAAGACRKLDGSIWTEHYRTVETNGQKVTFAAMCPASRVWRDKVTENGVKVMNVAGCDGYYMDQVGAFSTIDCRNAAHGHPFGGGHWWQDAYRTLLTDVRALSEKPVFLATECNAEHTLAQIDAFVSWNILGGIDTVPAFEVVYSTAAFPYCRSYRGGAKHRREMRMKFANVLADGELFGWFPAAFCRDPELGPYLRECVRFRWRNAPWFYKAEMRRPPVLLDDVPTWSEAWDVFGKEYAVTMPIVQTGARLEMAYDYAPDGARRWETGRPVRAFVYFTNFSDREAAAARVRIDWKDFGLDPDACRFTRVDAEGRRTPFAREALDGPLAFAPGACWGVEVEPLPAPAPGAFPEAPRAVFTTHEGDRTIQPLVARPRADGGWEVTVRRDRVPLGCRSVEVMCNSFFAPLGEPGWWLIGRGELGSFDRKGFVRTLPRERAYLSCFGWKTSKGARLAVMEGLRFEYETVVTSDTNGLYRAFPRWRLDDLNGPGGADEDMKVIFYDLGPDADYNEMAKCYRRYRMAADPELKPLKARLAARPHLAKLVRSLALRQEVAHKPVLPGPPRNFTAADEPAVRCIATFAECLTNLVALQSAGIADIQLCLAGWQAGGYDGRHPASFPVEPACGGEAELRRLIREAQARGVIIDSQSNYTDAYTCSPWWDGGDVACMGPTGKLEWTGGWRGGRAYHTCLKRAIDTYLPDELVRIRDLGFFGSAYIDVFSATFPYRCCNPRHPATRAEVGAIQRDIARRCRALFGGFSSECCYDHMLAYTDYINYVTAPMRGLRQQEARAKKAGRAWRSPVDRFVPFFELAFHDCVLSNPDKITQEIFPGNPDYLTLVEYGGRPIYYNLAGRVRRGEIPQLKAAYDEYRARADLMLEEMLRHEELAPGVVRVRYANGTDLYVNHTSKPWTRDGLTLAPQSFRRVDAKR